MSFAQVAFSSHIFSAKIYCLFQLAWKMWPFSLIFKNYLKIFFFINSKQLKFHSTLSKFLITNQFKILLFSLLLDIYTKSNLKIDLSVPKRYVYGFQVLWTLQKISNQFVRSIRSNMLLIKVAVLNFVLCRNVPSSDDAHQLIYVRGVQCNSSLKYFNDDQQCYAKSFSRTFSGVNLVVSTKVPLIDLFVSFIKQIVDNFCII